MSDTVEKFATGNIDVHSHLLPAVDDGCQSIAESLDCIYQLIEHGFVGSVCTPHVLASLYPDNVPSRIQEDVELLQAELSREGLEYQLWAGGEVRIHADTIDWLRSRGTPTIGNSNYVLIDYFGRTWPEEGDELCDHLLEQGYQPILAHPERMLMNPVSWMRTLDRLQQNGIKLQGNLNSLTGNEGRQAKDIGIELLKQQRYWVLAMDTHGSDTLDTRFDGIRIAESLIGTEQLHVLLQQRPREMLEECPIEQ